MRILKRGEQKAATNSRHFEQAWMKRLVHLCYLQERAFPTPPEAEALSESADEAEKVRELEEPIVSRFARNGEQGVEVFDTIDTDSASVRGRKRVHAYAVCNHRDVNLAMGLAQQLDQVAEVASEHLRQMTNGRYTIRRAGDKRAAAKKALI